MSKIPDFSEYGYQVIRELGRNREAGRITYLASTKNDERVVIKEFRFADVGADWSGFKAHEREIDVLKQLSHPRIPSYLNSFETEQGFCLVQEYKNAPSLAQRHSFTPEEVKLIAISVLEILIYLQQRAQPIIHRDIKPENILVDDKLNAYLVDFGFARVRGGEVALSSVAAGTPGFMPPEEHFGRSLTTASDLYSLGATLICLLTGTQSVDIGKLIDDNYRFDFTSKVSQVNPYFLQWLMKMVEPNIKNRFENADYALTALMEPMIEREEYNQIISLSNTIKTFQVIFITILSLISLNFLFKAKFNSFNPNIGSTNQNTVEQQQKSQEELIERLLKTNKCEGCELHKAPLTQVNLKGANLKKSDLSSASLQSANLEGANLMSANMFDVDLISANLNNANLVRVNFMDARMRYISLENAQLQTAKLYRADLEHSDMTKADLRRTDLRVTNLKNANFKNANLEGASLREAKLNSASFEGANLSKVDLRETDLSRVNWKNANLEGANLQKTKLYNANFQGINLSKANLRGADLSGVSLKGANLRDANLEDAILPETHHLKGAIMPDGSIN